MARMAQGMWTCGSVSMQIQNSYKDSLCFKNHPIPRDFWIQAINYFLLWKATIINAIRSMPNFQVWAITQVGIDTLRHVVWQCVLKQSPGYWLLSNGLTIAISFVFQFQAYFLAYDSNETQNFDGELQIFFKCKSKWYKS
jgi:hypothetical protein